jgi:hypothetical protein
MTDMNATTNPTAKTTSPVTSKATSVPAVKQPVVTLEQLAQEMKVTPRDARMLLRLAAKQKAIYPTLGKEHVARQPWQWTLGSKALDEARKALKATD